MGFNKGVIVEKKFLGQDFSDYIVFITINRHKKANALNNDLVDELTSIFKNTGYKCRAIIIQGSGKYFCSGVDLKSMKDSINFSREKNYNEAVKYIELFEAIYNIDVPTIALVNGPTYGGGIGIISCCDIVIASENASFCLSEARLGLIPATILPYLQRKMVPGQLKRLSLSSIVFNAYNAQSWGLVEIVCKKNEIYEVLKSELTKLLSCSFISQKKFKALYRKLEITGFKQDVFTAEAISDIRLEPSTQKRLDDFLNKKDNFTCNIDLPDEWFHDFL